MKKINITITEKLAKEIAAILYADMIETEKKYKKYPDIKLFKNSYEERKKRFEEFKKAYFKALSF